MEMALDLVQEEIRLKKCRPIVEMAWRAINLEFL
jgi:hypothetical protein